MSNRRHAAALLTITALCYGCGDEARNAEIEREAPDSSLLRSPQSASRTDTIRPMSAAAPSDTLPIASLSTPSDTPPFVQDTSLLVFGFVRTDGVVRPSLLRNPRGWAEVLDYGPGLELLPQPGAWAAAATYYVRDSLGTERSFTAGPAIQICCGPEGNPVWAHSTIESGQDVEDYVSGSLGYTFSALLPNSAFVQTSQALPAVFRRVPVAVNTTHDRFLPASRRPALGDVQALLDSLAPIPDSLLPLPDTLAPIVSIDVWEADLEGESHAYAQVRQIRRWQQYDQCFMVVGWLTADASPRIDVASSGFDDCDGKGHGTRWPYTLFRESGTTLMILATRQYVDGAIRIWRHVSGTTWLPLEFVPYGS